jgi:hypothetical protein
MKIKEFTRKDNSEGKSYHPQVGDKFECKAENIFETTNPRIVKGKAINITNYGISVEFEGENIFLNLTGGQAKILKKQNSLMNVEIVFEEYEHAEYGKQLGVRLAKKE